MPIGEVAPEGLDEGSARASRADSGARTMPYPGRPVRVRRKSPKRLPGGRVSAGRGGFRAARGDSRGGPRPSSRDPRGGPAGAKHAKGLPRQGFGC